MWFNVNIFVLTMRYFIVGSELDNYLAVKIIIL